LKIEGFGWTQLTHFGSGQREREQKEGNGGMRDIKKSREMDE
jgi:hypothetical protein